MAATDVLTTDEARLAVNTTGSGLDEKLLPFVEGVSGELDDLCGPIVARAVTEYHDGGCSSILLRMPPALSITTVTEYDRDGNATVLAAEDFDTKVAAGYLLESGDHHARLWRRASGRTSTFADGERNVVVVFQAGRYASTATVAPAWKRLASACLQAQWVQESGRWARSPDFDGEEDPLAAGYLSVADMVARRMPGALKPPGIA